MTSRRGITLIVVLLVLAILAGLATTLLVINQLDRSVSRNYLDTVRARQVAKSGIEFAIAKLNEEIRTGRAMTERRIKPSQYWGDVDNEISAKLPNEGLPLEDATNPSYAIEIAGGDPYEAVNPQPKTMKLEGRRRGVSMAMTTGTYGKNGDVATLRVRDTQGCLFVNDGLHETGGMYRPVTENMRRMLNLLGRQAAIGVPTLGDLLIDRRPHDGYKSRRQLLDAVQGDERLLEKFERFITIHAWVDSDSVLPVPLSPQTIGLYPLREHYYRGSGEPQYRGGRGLDYKGVKLTLGLQFAPPALPDDPEIRVWGLDELKPKWIQVTRRAPVNVNAAPREVLVSLLAGLQGFYLMEQRRKFGDEAAYPYGQWGGLGLYHWMITYYTYSPEKYQYKPWWTIWNDNNYEVDEADDLGRLYATPAFAGGERSGDDGTTSAPDIADEIIACRSRERTRNFDYSKAWFGGPFQNWRQFHAFCDNLVEVGFFNDRRSLFKDFPPEGADPWGWSQNTVPSSVQQRYASQAMADVLKANFNPNVHLNELNPDRALHLLVDKTDLIVNSTEFTFLPGGVYEIESLGRVLRPTGTDDSFTSVDNEVVSSAVCRAQVRLFDQVRHNVQKDFYAGELPRRSAGAATNNNRGLESGPEPDNGDGPQQCEFDGYVSLPTVGGLRRMHPKGTLESTPYEDSGERRGSKMHAHFNIDDRLHHHIDGPAYCENLARADVDFEEVENFPDPGVVGDIGPYMPSASGSRRLAWTFRVEPHAPPPPLDARNSLDLRIDGVYSERHSGLAYWLSPQVQPKDVLFQNGSACYWLKPSFVPELSGKSRQFMDLSVGAAKIVWGECPHQFTHYFYPGHGTAPGVVPALEISNPFYINNVGPTSMLFGMNWGGICTNPLNHESHGHKPAPRSQLRDHRWVHVILRWKKSPQGAVSDCAIYVNGKLEADPADFAMGHAAYSDVTPPNVNTWWWKRPDNTQNTVRLGAPSKSQGDYNVVWENLMPYAQNQACSVPASNPNANHIQNWSADATIDEFYFWGVPTNNDYAAGLESALDLWSLGRYAAVRPGAEEFSSKPLVFTYDRRKPAPPSRVRPPMIARPTGTTTEKEARQSTTTYGAGMPVPEPDIEVIGATWTLMTEDLDEETGEPYLLDHKDGSRVKTRIELKLKADLQAISTFARHENFSLLSGESGGPVRVQRTQEARYVAKFVLDGADNETILTESMFLDDVTILYSNGTEYIFLEID